MCIPKMHIGDVDIELIGLLQMWKKYANSSQTSISKSERKNMKSVDCIEWFCSLIRSRLEELRKDEKYSGWFEPLYYLDEEGWLVR